MMCLIEIPFTQVLLCHFKQCLFNSTPEIQYSKNLISFWRKRIKGENSVLHNNRCFEHFDNTKDVGFFLPVLHCIVFNLFCLFYVNQDC